MNLSVAVRKMLKAPHDRAPAVLDRWRAESVDRVWLRPDDWFTPAVEAAAEAVAEHRDVVPAAYRLGFSRGSTGVGIGEAIDDLIALFRIAAHGQTPTAAIRALAEGWSEGNNSRAPETAVDPESGVDSMHYLIRRLREEYSPQAIQGGHPADKHCLLMVDCTETDDNPWMRMARNAGIGEALTQIFGEGHPMARIGDCVYAVVVGCKDGPTEAVRVRHEVAVVIEELADANVLPKPPRVWVESLPASYDSARDLVLSLAR